MTDYISLRRGISKLSELVPNPIDMFNKLCSKQNFVSRSTGWPLSCYEFRIYWVVVNITFT